MLDAISRRRSVRTYSDQLLDVATSDAIGLILSRVERGFFGHTPRFVLVEKARAQGEARVKLGTYGFIKGPRYFVAGAARSGEMAEADYGYALEKIILELTVLNLGTCWLGGTFSRKEWGQVLKLEEGEFIPAITPVGHPAGRRGMVERMIRWGAKSDNRLPFEQLFFDRDFTTPLTEEGAGDAVSVFSAVRRGPSASNKQPWRIVRGDGSFHLYLTRTPGYANTVKSADLQLIDMGIAMCHLELAAVESGLPGEWRPAEPDIELPPHTTYIASWV